MLIIKFNSVLSTPYVVEALRKKAENNFTLGGLNYVAPFPKSVHKKPLRFRLRLFVEELIA